MATTKQPPKPVSKAPPARIAKAQVAAQKKKTELQKLLAKLDQLKMRRQGVQEAKAMLDSVPERVYTQSWCADYTEKATGDVETIEINAEPTELIVYPGARPAVPGFGGAITARAAQSGPQVYLNAAILPGVQKWLPTFRLATITALDYTTNTATVELLPARSDEQNLPINLFSTIASVPVNYMTCNAAAFKVGDVVVVEFQGQDWANPVVIGFRREPRKCAQPLLYVPYFKRNPGSIFGKHYAQATQTTIWGQPTGAMQTTNDFVNNSDRRYPRPFHWPNYGAWLPGFNNVERGYIQGADGRSIKLNLPFYADIPPEANLRLPAGNFFRCDIIRHPNGKTLMACYCDAYLVNPGTYSGWSNFYYDPYIHIFDLTDSFTLSTITPIFSHRLEQNNGIPYPQDEGKIVNKYLVTDGRMYLVCISDSNPEIAAVRDVYTFDVVATHENTGTQTLFDADSGAVLFGSQLAWPDPLHRFERRDILSGEEMAAGQANYTPETASVRNNKPVLSGNLVFLTSSKSAAAQVSCLQLETSMHGTVIATWPVPTEIKDNFDPLHAPEVLLGK